MENGYDKDEAITVIFLYSRLKSNSCGKIESWRPSSFGSTFSFSCEIPNKQNKQGSLYFLSFSHKCMTTMIKFNLSRHQLIPLPTAFTKIQPSASIEKSMRILNVDLKQDAKKLRENLHKECKARERAANCTKRFPGEAKKYRGRLLHCRKSLAFWK